MYADALLLLFELADRADERLELPLAGMPASRSRQGYYARPTA
jgi:hypothetical protein